jgi:DNA polymerase IIIc chi subunit
MCHVRKFPTWHICHVRKCQFFFSSLQKLKKERNYKLSIYYKYNPSYITWKKKKKKRNCHFFLISLRENEKKKKKRNCHFLTWQVCHVRKFPTWHICHVRKCQIYFFFSSLQKLKKKERNYKLSIYYKCNPSYITWKKKKKKRNCHFFFLISLRENEKKKEKKLPFSNVASVPH